MAIFRHFKYWSPIFFNVYKSTVTDGPSGMKFRNVHLAGCRTTSGPKPGEMCVFPFKYKGVEYDGCTDVDHGVPWCPVEVACNGEFFSDKWGYCSSLCPGT